MVRTGVMSEGDGSALRRVPCRTLEHATDLFLKGGQIPLDDGPDFSQIDTEIVVDQYVTHFDDLRPGGLRLGTAEYGSELAGGFFNDLDMVNHPGVDEFVLLEDAPPAFRVPLDSDYGVKDVL